MVAHHFLGAPGGCETTHAPGDADDLVFRQPVDLGDFAHRAGGLEADLVANHRRLGPAESRQRPLNDFVAFVPGEVDIDVGRVDAPGVEEAVEKQIVAQRIDMGNAQQVTDQPGSGAAPAAGEFRLPGDALGQQKDFAKSFIADNRQFVLQPFFDGGAPLPVTPWNSRAAALLEYGERLRFAGDGAGIDRRAQAGVVAGARGQFAGGGEGVGAPAHFGGRFGRRKEKSGVAGDLPGRYAVEGGVLVDGAQQAHDLWVIRVQVYGRPGGDGGEPRFGGVAMKGKRIGPDGGVGFGAAGEGFEQGKIPNQQGDGQAA